MLSPRRSSVGSAALAGRVAKEGRVARGFFHGWIAEVEPLLHDVDAQHGFNVERRAVSVAFGIVQRDQGHQLGPRQNAPHLSRATGRCVGFFNWARPRLVCFMLFIVLGAQRLR